VLTNRGDGIGRDLLELAADIRDSVLQRFGVKLEPEPVIVGSASS
jgi:UDP-N-acetylmuramate dehydrogenase